MSRDNIRAEITDIIGDRTRSAEEQIALLKTLREELRGSHSDVSHSNNVDGQNLDAQLNDIEEALKSIDARTKSS